MDSISLLFNPGSVAVIGASGDPSKTAGRPITFLKKHGFKGRLYPVNPRYENIDGTICYPSISALPEAPDTAIILLGPDRANQAVAELAARGTRAAIVLAGGYSEAGESGVVRQQALQDARGSMRILGPNTIGLINLTEGITLSASGALDQDALRAGNIAVISQSGGILGSILSRGAAAGIGFSKLVATSNEVDLDVADFVEHLVEDEATEVIALYLEGLRDTEKFSRAALKARAAGKPIVVFKVGRSEAGARSAASHTGALAGADALYDVYFHQLGIIRAQSFADLLDLPFALASRRRMPGKRVAILTSTGGAGTLIADALGVSGFDTPPPGQFTAGRLRDLDIGDQAVLDRNPIDLTLAGLQPEIMQQAMRILLESEDYDAVVSVVGSSGVARPSLMADAIRESQRDSAKPVLAYVSPHAPDALLRINSNGGVAFTAPESCASALLALQITNAVESHVEEQVAAGVVAMNAAEVDSLPPGTLNELQSKTLYARFGVPVTREVAVENAEQAVGVARDFGGSVALKVLSDQITHKTEVGGVALGLTEHTIAQALDEMRLTVSSKAGIVPDRFLIQEMVGSGHELILGFHRDPQLGPALLLGMGGVAAELIRDTSMRLLPIDRQQATAMLKELKTFALLDGYRGAPKADVSAVVDCILAFSNMAEVLGEKLQEAEINPLRVFDEGRGVRAVDGLTVLN